MAWPGEAKRGVDTQHWQAWHGSARRGWARLGQARHGCPFWRRRLTMAFAMALAFTIGQAIGLIVIWSLCLASTVLGPLVFIPLHTFALAWTLGLLK